MSTNFSLVELADQKVGSYFKATISLKVARLNPTDRDNVLDFLKGKVEWIPQVNFSFCSFASITFSMFHWLLDSS